MEKAIEILNQIIWSNFLIAFLFLTGLYFSIKTRFLQFRLLKKMFRALYKSKASKTGVSSFQAFALDLSGRIGTGNIAGVATAIAWGGPGSVFWMWMIALIGSATAFAEATLGQLYKEVKDGEYRGGPAFYIQKGIGKRWYAILFALTLMAANGLGTSGIQSNSIADGMFNAFNIPPLLTGIGLAVVLGLIIFGGVHRIAKTAQLIVPFMGISYLIVATVIIFINFTQIPAVLKLIVESAFGMEATLGGIVGSAISWGVKRGMFSNEAGQGTAPHASAAAEVKHPAQQGLVQAFSVYIDTILICTATAFIILFSGIYNVEDGTGGYLIQNAPGISAGTGFTQAGIDYYFPGWGTPFVAIALLMFAFTSLLAIYYRVETNFSFLFKDNIPKKALIILRLIVLSAIVYGASNKVEMAWKFGDIGVGLITWLNLIALFLLRKPILKCFKDYEDQLKQNKEPVFDSLKAGIKNAVFWEKKEINKEAD